MTAKLEQFLFYFLFFAIPFQTRKILYSPGWYYNEWRAISIYATDLILVTLFVFWFFNSRPELRIPRLKRYDLFLVGFLIAAAISVKNSSDFYSGFFLWLKLVEFALFYSYIKTYAIHKFNFIKILQVLLLGGVFQAVIAVLQFLKQGSLGLSFLGESVLGPHISGVAAFFIESGEKIMRAYGTTPHPNILAAYLFLAIFSFYFLLLYQKQNTAYHRLLTAGYVVMLVGFFFTFSRTIIFLWTVGVSARILISYFTERFRHQFWDNELMRAQILKVVLITLIASAIFAVIYWPEIYSRLTISSEEEAVRLRAFYNEESLKGGINLFGIGPGDFTGWLMEQNPNLPSFVYQPVHNIYLLIYSEVGLVGFVLFLFFIGGLLYEFFKKVRIRKMWDYSFLLVIASVLMIGLFDHFLLTVQQGRFIFWLSLALLTVLLNYDNIRDMTTRR